VLEKAETKPVVDFVKRPDYCVGGSSFKQLLLGHTGEWVTRVTGASAATEAIRPIREIRVQGVAVKDKRAPATRTGALASTHLSSRQETAREPGGAVVGVEVHIEIARLRQELGQRLRVIGEMRVGHERCFLPKLKVLVRQVQVLADR
jgi:hypothetical protein